MKHTLHGIAARLIASAFLLLVNGCAAKMTRIGYSKPAAAPMATCGIAFKYQVAFPQSEVDVLGQAEVSDSGFSRKCDEDDVLDLLAADGCALGADVVNITKFEPPDMWSTCYKATADFVRLRDRDAAARLTSDREPRYANPEIPAEQSAVIRGSRHGLYLLFYNRITFVRVVSIDGYRTDPDDTEWILRPGPHTITTAYWTNRMYAFGGAFVTLSQKARHEVLNLTALPGGRYQADGHVVEVVPDRPEYCAWIEDDSTDEIVSGTKDCHTAQSLAR